MAKKKHNTNNAPRRKRYNRRDRLQNAKEWVEQYKGKHIAKGYSNWFGVDLLCAITELEILGYKFKQSYKNQVKNSLAARLKQREIRKKEKELDDDFGEDMFYFVAGYTENGVPFGITKAEMEEDEETNTILQTQNSKFQFRIANDDLLF